MKLTVIGAGNMGRALIRGFVSGGVLKANEVYVYDIIEEAAKKTPGVADAVVNFMTQKMSVEFAEGADPKAVMKAVLKACKKVEPDCEIEL